MNSQSLGAAIKEKRTAKGLSQIELAGILNVSDKTISKWENGKGLPDISLLTALSEAIGLSVVEMFYELGIENKNTSANISKSAVYICPVCGNIIICTGEAAVCCHGQPLSVVKCRKPDDEHRFKIEIVEDEYYLTICHEMSKEHYISCVIAIKDDGYEMIKLYPEDDPSCRVKIRGTKRIMFYCSKHGMFIIKRDITKKEFI